MLSKAFILAAVLALAEARFGQEQVPIPAISAVTSGGGPGVAATIAGAAISDLLAAANPCAKLQRGDQIIAQLGTGADAVAAAKGMVAAELNFNPFVVSIPSICSDPTLPTTAVLRGITPLIDPAVGGAAKANALSAQSLIAPFSATGLSVAGVLAAQGFTNFTTKDLAGSVAVAVSATPVAATNATSVTAAVPTTLATVIKCGGASSATAAAVAPASNATVTTATIAAVSTPAASTGGAVKQSTIAGLDFGLCVPTMAFEGGLGGRPATEFTFQAIDPIVNKGQQEALNPNIITNRICDQLTNVCAANAAAKTACLAAKAQILALATKVAATADTWNTALGFAGTGLTPAGLP